MVESLDTGVAEYSTQDLFENGLEPGTNYCAYAYYMNPEETLTTSIGKAYFKTTGTAAASVKSVKAKAGHSLHRNYVERLAERPADLGSISAREISLPQVRQFGKR